MEVFAWSNEMFNDDVLAKCPKCNSSDIKITREEIRCAACNLAEDLNIPAKLQPDVAAAVGSATWRDVLQRWDFAG